MKKYWLWVLIALVSTSLVLGFFGRLNWVLDVFSHFRVYYFVAFLIIGIIALMLKKWREMGISFALSLVLFLTFADLFIPLEKAQPSEGLKIVSINLLSSNVNYQDVLKFISSNDFDVVFFQELNSKWKNELEAIGDEFILKEMFPREDNFGIGVYSKINGAYVQEVDFSTVNIPSLILTVQHIGREIKIINTHPLPPVGDSYFLARNDQFETLNRIIANMNQEIVLIGDLNSTRFSPNFNLLMRNGKLRDSRKGFGLLPTWHAQFPLISVTLDHAFITDGIEVSHRSVGPDIGSDHLPVFVEVGWK